MSEVDRQLERLRGGGQLNLDEIEALVSKVRLLMVEEGNVCRVDAPAVIVGDIHGQFFDMLEMFARVGMPPQTSFLFLGDLVDRGHNSIETLAYLLLLKVRFPDRVTMIRGNHESKAANRSYGFYDECRRKFENIKAWLLFTDLFEFFPLSAVVGGRIFCVHGGISHEFSELDSIRYCDRKQELTEKGIMADLLWSDPDPSDSAAFSPSQRGIGHLYGSQPVKQFLHTNDLELITRSHQMTAEGYEVLFDGKVITVWSAPNYLYRCGNKASVLCVDEKMGREFKMFKESERQARFVRGAVPEAFL